MAAWVVPPEGSSAPVCVSRNRREFNIVASYGMASTLSSTPTKRPIDSIFYSASSIAGLLRAYHCCRNWVRSITAGDIGGGPALLRLV